MMSDTTSDDESLTNKSTNKNVDLKPTKPIVPFTLASIPSSKPMGTSIVDQILLEESLRANQSRTGSVIKLKNCNKKLDRGRLTLRVNYTLFFQAVKNSSSHRMSSILEKERNQGKKRRLSQSNTKEEGAMLIRSDRKRSMLPKGILTLK